MRAIILGAVLALITSATTAEIKHIPNNYNEVVGLCLQKYGYDKTAPIEVRMAFDFQKASACAQDYLADLREAQDEELRDFLKHNPRYKYPGQSLNKCFGKPREMPFENSGIQVNKDGSYYAWVNYKDKIPAGCFETAPWDNRDKK